jgi:uncharacterized protein YegJ (DUF2314 family)
MGQARFIFDENWVQAPIQLISLMLHRLALALCFLWLSAQPFDVRALEPARDGVPSGSPMANSIRFEFAIFFLPSSAKDPMQVLRERIPSIPNAPTVVGRLPATPSNSQVSVHLENNVKENYTPPDLAMLKYFGRGLSREQAQALQESHQALTLVFAHPKANVWTALRAANELAETVAAQTGGLIWDAETREVFTPAEWRVRRLDTWNAGMPNVAKQTVIHAYRDKEFVRAITLGMAKMGLPDVVVNDFPWSMNPQVGNLINDFCQAMAEGASFSPGGEYDLHIKAIRHPSVRDPQLASIKGNATAVAKLALAWGTPEDGDPENRLILITADRYPGPDPHAKQESMVSSVFGAEDSVARIKHNDELREASKQARSHLPALKREFAKGLPPGEFILVKAPFQTPKGGTEWMWVEIGSWNKSIIRGLLQNDPFDIPTLHAGQSVEVDEEKVFDYIRRRANGTSEGNETSKIILQIQRDEEKR